MSFRQEPTDNKERLRFPGQIPRASLLYFLISRVEIQCASQFAMILLVGSTGCGKSSTLNHLLDTGDGIPFAETNSYESSTKKTSEYIL